MGNRSYKGMEDRGLAMSPGNREVPAFKGGMGKGPRTGWNPPCKMEPPGGPPGPNQDGHQ